MKKPIFTAALALAGLLFFASTPAHAGLKGQPYPSADAAARFRAASRQFLLRGGDIGKARADLFLLADANITSDFTDLVTPALADEAAYNGLAGALEDALSTRKEGEAERGFVLYNLARLHYLRSRLYRVQSARNVVLTNAVRTLERLGTDPRDPVAWELRGDIESERGDLAAAIAAYRRIPNAGGLMARSQYKTGVAYQRANRLREAETAYQAAVRAASAAIGADETQVQVILHYANQGLASVYLQQGNDRAAVTAIAQSAKVKQDPAAPFSFTLDVAQRLMSRGFAAEVLAYAEAAVRHMPEDYAARDLVEQAKSARP